MKVKILNQTGYSLPDECIGAIVEGTRRGTDLIMVSYEELSKIRKMPFHLLGVGLAFYEGKEVEVMDQHQQQSALNRAEDKYLDPPEDPPILCDDCGEDIAGQDRYEICGSIFCKECIEKFLVEGQIK